MGKFIVILIFVGIGIIRKLAEDAAKQRQQRAADKVAGMPKDQRAKVQSEIEAFLQGVTGKKPAPAQTRPRRQARSQRRTPQSQSAEQRRRQQRAQERERERSEAEDRARSRESREISHLDEHVSQYIGQHVRQHIGNGSDDEVPVEVVDEAVAGSQESRQAATVSASDVAAMLQTPAGMRQALIASEILARPRSLRR